MLEVANIHAAYGQVKVLNGVSLTLNKAEIVCLLGRNGAGKTTTLKAIMGLLPVSSGLITHAGTTISAVPDHQIASHGIAYIPQGRRLFRELTVEENLQIGLMAGDLNRQQEQDTRDWVLELFPPLRERIRQISGTLSGGEQQMLATARALCVRPDVLLMDEPSEGLQPSMIALIDSVIVTLKGQGMAVLLVEQRIDAALELADRLVFIENGKTVDTATPDELSESRDRIEQYLGIA